jgi:hypothetical protein
MFGILEIAVVYVVTPCNLVGAHKCYGGICCLHLEISSNLKMERATGSVYL